MSASRLLEAVGLEPQRAAVFIHGAHDVLGSAVIELRFDLERDGDFGSDKAREMLDDLLGD